MCTCYITCRPSWSINFNHFGALHMTMTYESYWIKVWSFWMVVLRMTMLQNFCSQAKATYEYTVFIYIYVYHKYSSPSCNDVKQRHPTKQFVKEHFQGNPGWWTKYIYKLNDFNLTLTDTEINSGCVCFSFTSSDCFLSKNMEDAAAPGQRNVFFQLPGLKDHLLVAYDIFKHVSRIYIFLLYIQFTYWFAQLPQLAWAMKHLQDSDGEDAKFWGEVFNTEHTWCRGSQIEWEWNAKQNMAG